MERKHHCFVCNNRGRLRDGSQCPLCSLLFKSNPISSARDWASSLDIEDRVVRDPMRFREFDKPWDQSGAVPYTRLREAADAAVLKDLRTVQQKLVSIAARNAEQRSEYHMQAKTLEKHSETKDLAAFITSGYQALRRAWLLIEKTEGMVSDRISALE
jgi:hypothetical protein